MIYQSLDTEYKEQQANTGWRGEIFKISIWSTTGGRNDKIRNIVGVYSQNGKTKKCRQDWTDYVERMLENRILRQINVNKMNQEKDGRTKEYARDRKTQGMKKKLMIYQSGR